MEKDNAGEKVHGTNENGDMTIIQMRKPEDIIKVYKTLENIFGK